MSKYMRQVSKEEFEMLTIFHPGEVRYYVDLDTVVNRNKGAKVSVKRKPKATKTNGAGGQTGVPHGRYVQLTTVGPGTMGPETVQYKVYLAVKAELNNDPTNIVKRTALTNRLCANSSLAGMSRISQVTPAVSNLVKRGILRYTGSPAS